MSRHKARKDRRYRERTQREFGFRVFLPGIRRGRQPLLPKGDVCISRDIPKGQRRRLGKHQDRVTFPSGRNLQVVIGAEKEPCEPTSSHRSLRPETLLRPRDSANAAQSERPGGHPSSGPQEAAVLRRSISQMSPMLWRPNHLQLSRNL